MLFYIILVFIVWPCQSIPLCDNQPVSFYHAYISYLWNLKPPLTSQSLVMPTTCIIENSDPTSGVGATDNPQCAVVAINQQNAQNGQGLVVNWPSGLPQTISVNTASSYPFATQQINLKYDPSYPPDFIAKTSRNTVWTSVYFKKPDAYNDPSASGIHPLYQLPPDFFNIPITFSQNGFQGWETYVVFKKTLLSKLVAVNTPNGNGVVWGIATSGCTLPIFTISMNWNYDNALSCNKQSILVTAIAEDTVFECTVGFSSNKLRSMGSQLSNAFLPTTAYAISSDSSYTKIFNSASHTTNIMNCIFPLNGVPVAYWGKYDSSSPGACVLCVQKTLTSSLSTPIARPCNRSLGETSECCYTCGPGYYSLYYNLDSLTKQQHCVAGCSPGSYFNDLTVVSPQCVKCPSGKFTDSPLVPCTPCAEMGFQNAYASPTSGCVSCGSRALATVTVSAACLECYTTCTPCPAMQYVPVGGMTCQPCPPGYVLRSVLSLACTPCPVGFYDLLKRCVQCPQDTYKAHEGNGSCIPCAPGMQSLQDNSGCVPCTNINTSIAPYAIYTPGVPGCTAMCNQSIAYAKGTNPYARGGCRPCSELSVPVGMYANPKICSQFWPCTNTIPLQSASLLKYTGSGNAKGICPWICTPGYYVNGSTCTKCNAKGFNQSVHAYTFNCTFACLPMLYYRGASNTDLSCNQKCVNLETQPLLYPRVRNYYFFSPTNGSQMFLVPQAKWPNYVFGYCGSTAVDPSSELAVVRYAGLYAYPATSSVCGNYLLNNGEQCDDGNTRNGDGCSSWCQIELNDHWDCDAIGEACQPLCCWQLSDLQGYVFPAPSGSGKPWCIGLTYMDFLQVPLAKRVQWMQTSLVSCQCVFNPHQQLSYSECNYTNRGCRQCNAGEYQDDLYARCTPCGSACSLGFRAFNASADRLGITTNTNYIASIMTKYQVKRLDQCGPSISTSQDLNFSDPIYDPISYGIDQMKIGCIPCGYGPSSNSPSMVIFIQSKVPGGCYYICNRDPTNQSAPNYYCQTALDPTTISCRNQACLNCDDSLGKIRANMPARTGYYITSCQDGIGHGTAQCTGLPLNANFTGNSIDVVGDSRGCPWQCMGGFQLIHGVCVPCFALTATSRCPAGQIIQPCTQKGRSYCAKCSEVMDNGLLQMMQVWMSTNDSKQCYAECEPGFAFHEAQNNTCGLCSKRTCNMDELLVTCTPYADTACTACSPAPINQEFYNPGTCQTRCIAGYATDSRGNCQSCSAIACSSGFYLSSFCQDPDERLALPSCLECIVDEPLNRPSQGRRFTTQGCITSCLGGWMQADAENLTCVPCNTSMCPKGVLGLCSGGSLQCNNPCPTPPSRSMVFSTPGTCDWMCAAPYIQDETKPFVACVLPSSSSVDGGSSAGAPGVASAVWGVDLSQLDQTSNSNSTWGDFPLRVLPHS